MKKLFAVLVLALSVGVSAKDVSFSYSGMESWGQAYYSCDYVESRTRSVLEIFGATNVDVTCSGGIQFGSVWPVNVSTSFDLPVLSGREIAEIVKFSGDVFNPACGLNVRIVKSLLPSFTNVSVVRKNTACAFNNSNYSYEFAIVR